MVCVKQKDRFGEKPLSMKNPLLFCFLLLSVHLVSQNSDKAPVFELRRVALNMDIGDVVGYLAKSGPGEYIERSKFKVICNKDFVYKNSLSESEMEQRLSKELSVLGLNISNMHNLFSELDEFKKENYSIALKIDSIRFNYDYGLSGSTVFQFHSYIFSKVYVLDLRNNKLVMKENKAAEFFSETQIPLEPHDFSYYFGKAWAQLAADIVNIPAFKRILDSEQNKADVSNTTEKLTLTKPVRKEQVLNVKKAMESVVTVVAGARHGSGAIVSANGLVLTCYHNVSGSEQVEVILSNNVRLKAKVMRYSAEFDVALLQIEGAETVALPLGNSGKVLVGEEVWAVGTPGFTELGQSVTRGVLSGDRTIDEKQYLQTDASVSPGNSGGPLLNNKGEVIGIVNAKVVAKGMEGIGFAIPVSVALEKLNMAVGE